MEPTMKKFRVVFDHAYNTQFGFQEYSIRIDADYVLENTGGTLWFFLGGKKVCTIAKYVYYEVVE
jgi:hypothetical protein